MLMHYAFPSHAATIDCQGGPPVALAHLPCSQGHYHCRASSLRLLSIAQKQMLSYTQARLDLAEKRIMQLAGSLAAVSHERGRRGGGFLSPEVKGSANKDGDGRLLEQTPWTQLALRGG